MTTEMGGPPQDLGVAQQLLRDALQGLPLPRRELAAGGLRRRRRQVQLSGPRPRLHPRKQFRQRGLLLHRRQQRRAARTGRRHARRLQRCLAAA